jgi:hypothetical protein
LKGTLCGWAARTTVVLTLTLARSGLASDQELCPPILMTFRSLRYGEFDYCRLRLRYQPGSDDCLRIVAPTCNFVVDGRRVPELVLGTGGEMFGNAERIVCPPGPPPPSCPAGYPG